MNENESDEALLVLLAALAKRRLTNEDIWTAFELSKARFYEARKDGLLFREDRLITAALNLGINPIELLAECESVHGITARDAVKYVDKKRQESELFDGQQATKIAAPTKPARPKVKRPKYRPRSDAPAGS